MTTHLLQSFGLSLMASCSRLKAQSTSILLGAKNGTGTRKSPPFPPLLLLLLYYILFYKSKEFPVPLSQRREMP